MVNFQTAAVHESKVAKRRWDAGGSNRYPAKLPVRPRPKPAPRVVATVEGPDLDAFDEALEHCCWCRERGMSPQAVGESIDSKHVPHTWGAAIDIIDQHIVKMRKEKK